MKEFRISAEIDSQTRAEMQGPDATANPYVPIHVSVQNDCEQQEFDPFVDYATIFFTSALHTLDDIIQNRETRIKEKESMDFLFLKPQADRRITIGRPVSEDRTQRDPETEPELQTIALDRGTVSRGILSSVEEYLNTVYETNENLRRDRRIKTLSRLLEDKQSLLD